MKTRGRISIAWFLILVLATVALLAACQEGPPPPPAVATGSTTAGTPAAATAAATPVASAVATGGGATPEQKIIDNDTLATRIPLKVDEKSVLQQGEASTICGVTIRVNSMERQPAKGTGGKRDLMVVSVGLDSKAEKPVAIIPYDFYLSDMAGKTIDLSYGGEVKTPLSGGQLAPGKSMGGEMGYDVTSDKKDFRVLWMPGWCAEKAVVQIKETQALTQTQSVTQTQTMTQTQK